MIKNNRVIYIGDDESIVEFRTHFRMKCPMYLILDNNSIWYCARDVFNLLGYAQTSSMKFFKKNLKDNTDLFRYYQSRKNKLNQTRYLLYISHLGLMLFLEYVIENNNRTAIEVKQNARRFLNFLSDFKDINEKEIYLNYKNMFSVELTATFDTPAPPTPIIKMPEKIQNNPHEITPTKLSLKPELRLITNEEFNNRSEGIISLFQWYDNALYIANTMIHQLQDELKQCKVSEKERSAELKKKLSEYESKVLFADEILAIKKNLDL